MGPFRSVEPSRVRRLNSEPSKTSGSYVLYWIQSAQRAEDNPALEFAVERANALGLPLVAAFVCTPDYPEANLRHYTFMLEGVFEALAALASRKVLPRLEKGHPPDEILRLSGQAAEVVVCRGYLRHLKSWYEKVAAGCGCLMWQVETEAVVPVELVSEKAEYAARTIRPRVNRHLQDFLIQRESASLSQAPNALELEPFPIEGLEVSQFLKDFDIDRSVKPVTRFFRGGQQEAKAIYESFLEERLDRYEVQRNQPQTDFTSKMSPYLHFGMVSAVYLSLRMLNSGLSTRDDNVKSYLEELIVRRALSFNFTNFEKNYDSYRCLPDWAARTLREHAADPRPELLSREQLEAGESHDPYWNAAQVEMVETGYMHNYMRMYWGKKILEWSDSPESAFETTLYLNNKYLLDGRDSASFANVAWIYGVHDRAWQERAIYGKIRCMMASGLERKSDPKAYVKKIEDLTGREVLGKSWL